MFVDTAGAAVDAAQRIFQLARQSPLIPMPCAAGRKRRLCDLRRKAQHAPGMSGQRMSLVQDENFNAAAARAHPVDVVEETALAMKWPFERDQDDEICMTIAGGWSEYQLSFSWIEDVEALHLACAFDIKINPRRRAELQTLVGLINEQLWIGHFGIWDSEKLVMFRHASILAGGARMNEAQCAGLMKAAVEACEQYYQAFQFVLWAGKSAKEALEGAMFETAGEA